MSKPAYHRNRKVCFDLDPDKLGLLVGSSAATMVMVLGFFVHGGSGLWVAWWSVCTLVAAYIPTFMLVGYLRYVRDTQLREKPEAAREAETGANPPPVENQEGAQAPRS